MNPEHGDEALYAAVRAIGGTRVSLGTQSTEAEGLRTLGRVHSPDQALASIAAAAAVGLRVSADLIVGWPGQTAPGVRADVARLTAAGAEHVSVYALTIEADTPWPTLVRRGKRRLPDSDHQADMLAAAEEALTGAGLQHYEVASYARAGRRRGTTCCTGRGRTTWGSARRLTLPATSPTGRCCAGATCAGCRRGRRTRARRRRQSA
ncbi:hypothetical protein [Nannocystis pusilla]|uniref:hypothetical protein n=1 Tax=Nannocystis pusilla TaxID=889268 RepID=UPI003B7D7522